MLCEYLEAEGCSCAHVTTGEEALERFDDVAPDIVILDIMMPGIGGIETLKTLRGRSRVAILMLTAKGDDLDRILGLELGADDYLPKPCNPRELLARIRAIVRRSQDAAAPEGVIIVEDLKIDPAARAVSVAGVEIQLTQTEFDLLHLVAGLRNQVVSKKQISSDVLGKPLSQWDRSIDVHISNLRKKLGDDPAGSPRIRTVRGAGYMFVSG